MKNFFKFLTVSFVFSLAFNSCTNEDSLLNIEESTKHTFEINASLASLNEEDETTRSSITSNVIVEWTKDAAISVINLSTKKVLGGNLVAQKAGTNTTFVGTVTGSISAGDKLAFIYPAKNIAAEKTLESSDFVYDLFGSQTTTTPFVAKYTYTVPDNSKNITLSNADFTFLSAYLKMNLSTLPGNTEVTNVTIENMGTSLSCIPNSDYSDLTATGTLGDINIDLSTTTKEKGYVVVKFSSAPSAKQEQERKVTVKCGKYNYISSLVNNEIKSNAYVNANVTAFDEIKYVPFEDINFKNCVMLYYDKDGDNEISFDEAEEINDLPAFKKNITSLKGIEYFKNLTKLWCDNNNLTSLDISKNTKLTVLECNNNQLTTLDVSKNIALERLKCNNNQLSNINVSKSTKLAYLNCDYNQLTSLDVSNNTALKDFYCRYNQLTSLDVSKNIALTNLQCTKNQLSTIDVSKNTSLSTLFCNFNELTTIDVSKNSALVNLFCNNNKLTSLDVSKNTKLSYLYCNNNQLTNLDLSKNSGLNVINCEGNPNLTTIYISDSQKVDSNWSIGDAELIII